MTTDLASFARKCHLWNDEFLLEQLAQGPGGYADIAFFGVIQAEAAQRGLAAEIPAPAPTPPSAPEPPAIPMTGPILGRLWQGHVPLWDTYWIWGVGGRLLFIGLTYLTAQIEPMIALLLVGLSIGYTFFITIAIWRSAGRYAGPRHWAVLARIAVTLGIARTVIGLVGLA